jgi:uncharacterized protein YkwD
VTKRAVRFLLPACIATTLSLFALVPSSHAATVVSAGAAKTHSASLVGTVKRALLVAINADRAAHGAGPLTISVKQSRCSTQHADKMASTDQLFHTNLQTDVCSSRPLVGQNVGMDSGTTASSAITMHQMMMAEGPCPHVGCPGAEFEAHGHYVNILSKTAHHIGIGIAIEGGTMWLTEDFTK